MANNSIIYNPHFESLGTAVELFKEADDIRSKAGTALQKMRENIAQDERTGLELLNYGLNADKFNLDKDKFAFEIMKAEDDKAKAIATLAQADKQHAADMAYKYATLQQEADLKIPASMLEHIMSARAQLQSAEMNARSRIDAANIRAGAKSSGRLGLGLGEGGIGIGMSKADADRLAGNIVNTLSRFAMDRIGFIDAIVPTIEDKFKQITDPSSLSKTERNLYDNWLKYKESGEKTKAKLAIRQGLMGSREHFPDKLAGEQGEQYLRMLNTVFPLYQINNGELSANSILNNILNIGKQNGLKEEDALKYVDSRLRRQFEDERKQLADYQADTVNTAKLYNRILGLSSSEDDEEKLIDTYRTYFGHDRTLTRIWFPDSPTNPKYSENAKVMQYLDNLLKPLVASHFKNDTYRFQKAMLNTLKVIYPSSWGQVIDPGTFVQEFYKQIKKSPDKQYQEFVKKAVDFGKNM